MKTTINRNRSTGSAFPTYIVSIPLVVVVGVVIWYAYCEGRKAFWDHQVDLMCAKDGGIKVFQQEKMSLEMYKHLGGREGEIPIYSRSSSPAYAPYFTEETTTYLHEKNPQVRRSETQYKKSENNKTVATYVYYARVGGDFPSYAHPSSHGCAPQKNGLTRQFIQVEGESK